MRMSMETAFNNIAENEEEALDLFFIVSLFPAGISVPDINSIWGQLKKHSNA